MTKRIELAFHSEYSPDVCLAKLSQEIDIDRWTIFFLSGYKGDRPILGRIVGNEFRMHKRRYWHNSFGPVLFGRALAEGRGTLIEAYWGNWRWPLMYMRLWTGFACLLSIPILVGLLRDVIHGKSLAHDNLWLGLVVPLALVGFGFLFPQIGATLSSHERKPILELLEGALAATRRSQRGDEKGWRTSLDGGWHN